MTWREPKRNDGDERIRIRFAWLPVRCWDGDILVTKWLEKVTTRQRFVKWPKCSFWCDEQFIYEKQETEKAR